MKTKYTKLASILAAIIIDEITALNTMFGNDSPTAEDERGASFQEERINNLEKIQRDIHAIAGGFSRAPEMKSNDVTVTGKGLPPLSEMLADLQKKFPPQNGPKVDPLMDLMLSILSKPKATPSENKAQCAADEAKKQAAQEHSGLTARDIVNGAAKILSTGAGASVGGTAADFRTVGEQKNG